MITKRSLLRTIEREREHHSAERKLLIDQILHLSGNTWTPPPLREVEPAPPLVEPEDRPQASPEQHITV